MTKVTTKHILTKTTTTCDMIDINEFFVVGGYLFKKISRNLFVCIDGEANSVMLFPETVVTIVKELEISYKI